MNLLCFSPQDQFRRLHANVVPSAYLFLSELTAYALAPPRRRVETMHQTFPDINEIKAQQKKDSIDSELPDGDQIPINALNPGPNPQTSQSSEVSRAENTGNDDVTE